MAFGLTGEEVHWSGSVGEMYDNVYLKTFQVLLTFNLRVPYLGAVPKGFLWIQRKLARDEQ